jgi:glycosyltransferase involved in cell wall biosynthesis
MNEVVICPSFDAFYYSFYIDGIFNYFGKSNVRFSYRGFPHVSSERLAFIVKQNRHIRIAVDAYDGAVIQGEANRNVLAWCDIYGKVNLVSSFISKDYLHKCIPIGPSIPVYVWSPIKAWGMAIRSYRPANFGETREHFANYRRQYKYRLSIDNFVPGLPRDNYIFFSSSLWDEEEASNTNRNRAWFIEACRSIKGITFEGGFSPPRSEQRAARYKAYITNRRFSLAEWLEKTRRSALVFFTPAVWSSHTFKLAEFLALGKAIISTPMSRELPAPLIHGKHIHYVSESQDAFRDAIEMILGDREYKAHLEENALKYYRTYLTPERVIERVLSQSL